MQAVQTYSIAGIASRLLMCLALALAILAFPSAASAGIDSVEREQLNLINSYRASQGLPRLVIDAKLTRTANWMAADMPAHGYFSHTDHLGRDPFKRLTSFGYPANTWRGENLAAGNDSAAATFQQWKNSEGHRLNMVGRNFRAIGIARVHNPNSEYGWYWVTEFGSKVTRRASASRRARSATTTGTVTAAQKKAAARFSSARRTQIRRRAKRCTNVRVRSASYRRLACRWHIRTARSFGRA